MKWRRFTKEHAIGMGLGIITPLICVPLVILLVSWMNNYDFSYLWNRFQLNHQYQIRMLTLSIISNLIWFYFFLNRERYDMGRGVILGSLAFAPYVIYIKFFA